MVAVLRCLTMGVLQSRCTQFASGVCLGCFAEGHLSANREKTEKERQ